MKKIKWGILGCGGIAHQFAKSLAVVEGGQLVACASRTDGKANIFSKRHDVPQIYTCYKELLSQTDVDAIYVATTHNFHLENVKLALAHGKHVLCEKPLGVNAKEVQEMRELAVRNQRFLMEGMWTRYLPAVQKGKRLLASGRLGKIRELTASFCFDHPYDPAHRLYNPELAGGSLLDVGIYVVSFAGFVFETQPEEIQATAEWAASGVDQSVDMVFTYADGASARLRCSICMDSDNAAEIKGDRGSIMFPRQFYASETVELHLRNQAVKTYSYPFKSEEAFAYEIKAAHQAILAGQNECARYPLSEVFRITETMDRIAQIIRT